MVGVYLLGRCHAVNTPLPYSQWTSEKKKQKKKKNMKRRENKNERQKLSFKPIF